MVPDRDILIGTFCLLASLAEKLTGQRPKLSFQIDGIDVPMSGTDRVKWIGGPRGPETQVPAADPAELSKTGSAG